MDLNKVFKVIVCSNNVASYESAIHCDNVDCILIIVVGDIYGHAHCKPRKLLSDLNQYESFQFMILKDRSTYLDIEEADVFINNGVDLSAYVDRNHSGGNCGLSADEFVKYCGLSASYARYVPKAVVEDFITKFGTLSSASALDKPSFLSAKSSEKPCKVCGRNNDVGISVCWYCGVNDP